jgi:hypothetical protein
MAGVNGGNPIRAYARFGVIMLDNRRISDVAAEIVADIKE